jgi:hypothetical protein
MADVSRATFNATGGRDARIWLADCGELFFT